MYAGSRFTTPTEAGYSPTKGKSLAVAWALDNARMFVLGCGDLMVSTDHKPLLGILRDRDLSRIPNDCIISLKGKTFCYQFSIQFCPGKWHQGPDAVSRNPSISTVSLISIIRQPASIKDLNSLITLQEIQDAYKVDQSYQELAKTIANGFPKKRNETSPSIRDFWEVRDCLSSSDRIIHMDYHIVIPPSIPANLVHYKLHKDWIISANQHEKALAQRNENITKKYNVSTHQLPKSPSVHL